MKINYGKVAGAVCVGFLSLLVVVQLYYKYHCQSGYVNDSTCYYGMDQWQDSTTTYFSPRGNSIQEVNLDLKVNQYDQTQNSLNRIVSKYNGSSISLSSYNSKDGAKQGTMVFEVAPYYFDVVLTDLRNLGQVRSEYLGARRSLSSSYYYTPVANIDELQLEREQWLGRYTQVNSQETSRQIEAQLARLSQEIQNAQTNVNYVPAQPEMITFTVSYLQEPFPFLKVYKNIGYGLVSVLGFMISLVVKMVNGLIAVLTYLLPLAVWVGIISLAIFFISKFFRKDRIMED